MHKFQDRTGDPTPHALGLASFTTWVDAYSKDQVTILKAVVNKEAPWELVGQNIFKSAKMRLCDALTHRKVTTDPRYLEEVPPNIRKKIDAKNYVTLVVSS